MGRTLVLICYVIGYLFLHASSAVLAVPSAVFYRVGNGDAVLVRNSSRELLLVDGGPTHDVDFHMVESYESGLCSISFVVLTHPHADHLAGLLRILKHCDIETVYFNPVSHSSVLYSEWKKLLEKSGVSVKTLKKGDSFKFGEFTVHCLWPPENLNDIPDNENLNNHSIVLLLDSVDKEILLLGDAESSVLKKLDTDFINSLVQGGLDVIKISHHGASDSMSQNFYDELTPNNVVISVGAKNKYGHPNVEVMSYFESRSVPLYRTDHHGTVRFSFK